MPRHYHSIRFVRLVVTLHWGPSSTRIHPLPSDKHRQTKSNTFLVCSAALIFLRAGFVDPEGQARVGVHNIRVDQLSLWLLFQTFLSAPFILLSQVSLVFDTAFLIFFPVADQEQDLLFKPSRKL